MQEQYFRVYDAREAKLLFVVKFNSKTELYKSEVRLFNFLSNLLNDKFLFVSAIHFGTDFLQPFSLMDVLRIYRYFRKRKKNNEN